MYQILIPFLMRTAMIYFMGVEYLGLNSLFSSVLQVLNLAELGVGSAMVYSMYKPIAEDDTEAICGLEKLYRKYYNWIGFVIAVIGGICTPFIPKLISGDVPSDINIYILYLLNLAATVLTYWLFSYKNSLFLAHQRNDVTSKITLLTNTFQYLMQLMVLWLFHNYYFYVIIMLLSQTMTNILTAVYADKIYPNYKPKGELSKKTVKEINRRIKDLFTAKLGATIVNSADTIVISAFLGLTVLAIYQNYYFIMTSVSAIITIILNSFLAGIGNSMVTESIEKNYRDFKKIVFIINWIVNFCICCFACLYQPFIRLWVGKKYLFEYTVVILFCVYFYLVIMQQVIGVYKDAAGIWHQDRFRPLIASIVNLVLNLLFVRKFGIYAIILSTIISYIVVAMPWMISNVFRYVFKRSWKEYVKILFFDASVCIGITIICVIVCNSIKISNLYIKIVINVIVCGILSNILLWIINKNNLYYNDMLDYLNKFSRNKLQKLFIVLKTK